MWIAASVEQYCKWNNTRPMANGHKILFNRQTRKAVLCFKNDEAKFIKLMWIHVETVKLKKKTKQNPEGSKMTSLKLAGLWNYIDKRPNDLW